MKKTRKNFIILFLVFSLILVQLIKTNAKKEKPENPVVLFPQAIGVFEKWNYTTGATIRTSSPCVADLNSKLCEYCADILKIKDEIPNIPGGDGKIRYILPNLLSEILIGMIQGDMFSFTRTIGSILSKSKDEVKVYIVMEYN